MLIECQDMSQLMDIIQVKTVVCWGIGNYFYAFLDSIYEYRNKIIVRALIDNQKDKQGKKKMVFNRTIPICSFEKYIEKKQKTDVIIITTVHYHAIIEQLRKYREEIDYIIYPLIRHGNVPHKKTNIQRCKEMLIPAKIHYCWFGEGEIPKKDYQYIMGWKEKCPNYEFVCWNEKKFDIFSNNYVRYAYKEKKWAFVSDYVRMHALYHQGGIYLDTDVELLKNLDPLRYQYAYMGMEESGCVNSGIGIGTVPYNPLIKEILDGYEELTLEKLERQNCWMVNALWETDILRKYGFKANNKYQIIRNIAIFPSEFFSPILVGKKEVKTSYNTFSIHHYHYSWMNEAEREKIWNTVQEK